MLDPSQSIFKMYYINYQNISKYYCSKLSGKISSFIYDQKIESSN